jgi:hypothetical protein
MSSVGAHEEAGLRLDIGLRRGFREVAGYLDIIRHQT